MLRLQECRGPELTPYLDGLGNLRITVFREFPYLYEGTLAYEREYLRTYSDCPRSLVVLAMQGAAVVGASTCLPLADEEPEFKQPFLAAGMDVNNIFYFGESILLPEYRGQGLGKEFFARRERHSRSLGFAITAFCSVDRPADHPLRPPHYRPLDAFWTSQGYTRRPDLQATFVWKETGEEVGSPKTLTFWIKEWPKT
jgi:GNAT superfamily N-acetyltransferase